MTTKMLPILEDRYLEDLASAVRNEENLRHYRLGDSFPLDSKRILHTNVKLVGDFPELRIDADDTKGTRHECENAIRLYEYFSGLSDVQASDPRLWAYLSHNFYFSFIRKRKKIGPHTSANTIARRFFVSGVLSQNTLAGMWWAVRITKSPWESDESLMPFKDSDPYKYTRILFSNQDIYVGLLERKLGRAERLLIYVLDSLGRRLSGPNKIKNVSVATQRVFKELNLLASYRVLESIPHEEMKAMVEKVISRVVES